MEYKDWLMDRVGFREDRKYSRLMTVLHHCPFVWLIERDQNRMYDGLDLRREFILDMGISIDEDCPCSVLEMLIALAIRVDQCFLGNPADPRPDKFFWEMLSNLDLDLQDDKHFDPGFVTDTLNTWLYREFDSRGNGSIFPVSHDDEDQRTVEIWDQMLAYLYENYR